MMVLLAFMALRSDAYWFDNDSRHCARVASKNLKKPRSCTVIAQIPTNPFGNGRDDDENHQFRKAMRPMGTHKTKTWRVEGLQCGGCVQTVRSALQGVLDDQANVNFDPPILEISDKWTEDDINSVLSRHATEQRQYRVFSMDTLSDSVPEWDTPIIANNELPVLRRFVASLKTYAPLIGIFTSLLVATGLAQVGSRPFNPSLACRHFMGGWFLVFSCMKLINLRAFVDAFARYDLLAQRWRMYGFVYPFIELVLGMVYLGFGSWINPPAGFVSLPFAMGLVTKHRALWQLINLATLLVMGAGSVGVAKALREGKQLVCACLGGGRVKLPMSYVSLAEDVVMAGMALVALVTPLSL
jgi:copper chaperone CopZ